MSTNPVQKAFGAGDTGDDEILYGSGSPVSRSEGQRLHQENVDSLGQSNPGAAHGEQQRSEGLTRRDETAADDERDTDTGDEPKKRGFLSKLMGKSDKDEQPRDIPYEKWREEHGVTGASPGAAGAAALEARRKQSSDDARHDGEDSEKKGGLLSKLRGSKSDKDDKSREASSEHHREETGVAAAGTAGAAGIGGLAYEEQRKKSEEPGEDSQKKGGLLSKFRSSKNKDSEASASEPTAHDNELGQGATVAGAGALGATGVGAAAYESHPRDDAAHEPNPRVNTHDDVSRATYTERAHHLGSNEHNSSNVTAVSQPPPTTDSSHFGRDAALAGAGAGVVGGGAYAATRGHDQPTSSNVTAASHPPPGATTTADNSHFGRDAAVTGAGAGVVGGGAYAATRGHDQPASSNVTAASHPPPGTASTYTERSYPLPSGSEAPTAAPGTTPSDSHLGRDAALVGAGAGVVGGGAYAATRDREIVAPETTSGEIMQRPRPEQMDSVSRLHVPGEFPREDGMDPHAPSGVPASTAAPVAVAAAPVTLTPITHTSHAPTAAPIRAATIGAVTAGAGGAAAASSGLGEEGAREVGHSNRQRFFGRPEARSHIIPQFAATESHTGRDAALIGAGAAGTGAVGVAAVEARRDVKAPQGPAKFNHPPQGAGRVEPHDTNVRTDRPEAEDRNINAEKPQHDYGRDGALAAATAATGGAAGYEATRHHEDDHNGKAAVSPDDNRVSIDPDGRHHLHKKSEEQAGEKKPGFLSKLLHRDKNRKENDEPDSPGSREYAHQQQSSPDAVTAAQTASAGHPLAEGGTGKQAAAGSSGQYMTEAGVGLPVGEDGLIHIVNEGAPPDAPALVMKHDGSEVFQHKQDL
ncbi:hypothetical protein BDY17DRAFT_308970 [Neohortaea acidophila]|uniref:Uncharacterized protein n=1 Tax=Neohortaea acidophila TaxID=245834 RepID=A0A6A6Q1S3_9PEZI|nr:uncharacterized protein BDY17DRAFT_308970 [Neohortaea acidophila]KAF2485623.1 hypothetical protein BDY17DRAFT_308970 [Neohortaea acidophila]